MYLEFRKLLGDGVTNTLMEHLPPEGWGDVARSRDLDNLQQQLIQRLSVVEHSLSERITVLDSRIHNIEGRLDRVEQRLKGITGTLWILIGSMVTVSSALLVMMIQLNTAITRL